MLDVQYLHQLLEYVQVEYTVSTYVHTFVNFKVPSQYPVAKIRKIRSELCLYRMPDTTIV